MGVLKRPDPSSTPLEVGQDGFYKVAFKAMGTACDVLYESTSTEHAERVRDEVVSWVRFFENRYSRYLPNSFISEVNAAAGIRPVSLLPEDERLLNLCRGLHFMTKGLFDPTTLPLSLIWDFRKKNPRIPEKAEITRALSLVGWSKVELGEKEVFLPAEGMGLDFGGFGKEYAVDRVLEIVRSMGVRNAMVNFGGDVALSGRPSDAAHWRIGVENPKKPGQPDFALSVTERGVATSGTYMRFFEMNGKRYSHLIDHRTGYPVSGKVFMATAIASTCLEAGALSTCSLIGEREEGLSLLENFFGAEGCLRTERALYWTRNFDKYLIHNES